MGRDQSAHKGDAHLPAVGMTAEDQLDVMRCIHRKQFRAVAQEVCPTVVSMVFDVDENTVYWCEDRNWDKVNQVRWKK